MNKKKINRANCPKCKGSGHYPGEIPSKNSPILYLGLGKRIGYESILIQCFYCMSEPELKFLENAVIDLKKNLE